MTLPPPAAWRLLLGLLGIVLLTAGCGPSGPESAASGKPGERTFQTRGEVREIAADRRTARIRHDEIPGYMARMTMEFSVRNPEELAEVQVGDVVAFRLVATEDTHWIDSIRVETRGTTNAGAAPASASAANPANAATTPAPAPPPEVRRELKPGDPLPDVTLRDEDGQALRLSDYRGGSLALTFFFTRCPLPDFCPRMNKNFAEARRLLNEGGGPTTPAGAVGKPWHFLSISFDPDFDQPAVLRGHAPMYRGNDTNRWRFAVADATALTRLAPALDLRLAREGGSFSHNLRTVVVDAEGRIFRQFDGNRWTAADLAEAVRLAAQGGGVTNASLPRSMSAPGIENFFQVATGLYSGSQPEGDAAFAALRDLGVKTLLSVDGALPDVERAAKFGLRYLHIPHGYDGIPAATVATLVRAAQSADGPVFVHCHHGRHRGVAAVGVICQATAGWTTNQALAWLKLAGTSTNYAGLFRANAGFRMPSAAELASVPTNFPSRVRVSSLVDAMVEIDQRWDRLKAMQQAGWRALEREPDLVPVREALLLRENLRELGRTGAVTNPPPDFTAALERAEAGAAALQVALASADPGATAGEAMKRVAADCSACHRSSRDRR